MSDQQNLRLLIIDDNLDIHQDFIQILKLDSTVEDEDVLEEKLFGQKIQENKTVEAPLLNFQINCASQGQEGVECIRKALEEGKPYALAFVDIRMPPGWNGVETIKHIWELDRDIQIVICTAYSDYTWEETIGELGESDNLLILKKPFDAVAVRQLAYALTKKWKLMRDAKNYTASLEKHVQERTEDLQKSLSLIRATFESSSDAIIVVDASGNIINNNTKFTEMWQISEPILGKTYDSIVQKYIISELIQPKEFTSINHNASTDNEINTYILKLNNGKIYEYYSQPCKLEDATIGIMWGFRDVTQRIYLEEKMEYQLAHDPLTDLPNRVLLFDRINQSIVAAKRSHTLVALLFFDLDRFKLVNDSLGHKAGDELLKQFSKRIHSFTREVDTFSRSGGDEFVMIVSGLKNEEDIAKISNNILNLLKEPFKIFDHEIIMTSSIGIAFYPKNGKTADELLTNSDIAMYKAKECGTNQFQFYNEEFNQQTSQRFKLEGELRRAIEKEEFFLCYQPQFSLKTKSIVALEALIRWNHPERGLLLPVDFIPLADATGLIIPIGEWVLREACKQNKAWQKRGFPLIPIAVNIGMPHLRQHNFITLIKNILEETELSPEYLEIELTENIIYNNSIVFEKVNELKKIGVRIALDDFGAGEASSIVCLRKLPLDHVKIDKSFVQDIDSYQSDEVIVQAIIAMAKSLNLKVTAEGVETQKQLHFLETRECDDIQGFYYSEPLNTEDMEKLLENKIPPAPPPSTSNNHRS